MPIPDFPHPVDVASLVSSNRAVPEDEGSRMYREALRAAQQLGPPAAKRGDESWLVRWPRTSLWQLRRLDRWRRALSRWREASRRGGTPIPLACHLDGSSEVASDFSSVAWLARLAELSGRRLVSARKNDWALELYVDLLGSARDLRCQAPLEQACLACEVEMHLWRELRQWAAQKRTPTELADRAVRAAVQLCSPLERRRHLEFEYALLHEAGRTADHHLRALFACALECCDSPRPERKLPTFVESEESQPRLGFPAAFAERHGLAPCADGEAVSSDVAAAARGLQRALDIFDQRDTAAGATLAVLATAAYHRRFGYYPADLSSVCGEFDVAVPRDPFDKQAAPLKMRPGGGRTLQGRGVDNVRARVRPRSGQPLIYSAAANGRDDDAEAAWDGSAAGDGDWVFPLPPHRRPRHWRQFDVRKAMILITLLCVFMAYLFSGPARQLRAVRAIKRGGGEVEYAADGYGAVGELLAAWFGAERFGRVVSLSLNPSQATDDMLKRIGTFEHLTVLDLEEAQITDQGLQHLQRLTQLTALNLEGTPISGVGLRHLAGMSELQSLHLVDSKLTDQGLRAIPRLPSLTSLNMTRTNITGSGFRGLAARLPRLQELYAYTTAIDDEALEEIGRMKGLRHLDLDGTRITDPAIRQLSGLVNLECLDMQNTGLGDDALQHLVRLRSLNELRLNNTQVRGPGLAHLAALPKLRELQLDNTSVDNAAVPHILQIPSLATVHLQATKLTSQGIRRLQQAPGLDISVDELPGVETLLEDLDELRAYLDKLTELKEWRERHPDAPLPPHLRELFPGQGDAPLPQPVD